MSNSDSGKGRKPTQKPTGTNSGKKAGPRKAASKASKSGSGRSSRTEATGQDSSTPRSSRSTASGPSKRTPARSSGRTTPSRDSSGSRPARSSGGSAERSFRRDSSDRDATGQRSSRSSSTSKSGPYKKRTPGSAKSGSWDASKRPAPRPRPSASAKTSNADSGKIRLNKYIANAGVCSRREADVLIAAGNVTVNGKIISEMGYKVDPTDEVRFDGRLLQREKKEYVLLNKPKNFITTTKDEKGRRTVMELITRASSSRLPPVGRLDRMTTGLLLFTNDGELTKKLTHPKHGVRKIYHVELDSNLKAGDMASIRKGLELEDGLIEVDEVSYIDGVSKREVGIEIHSGRNRIVRRIFEHLGYQVVKLDRVVLAGLTKKDLPRGHWRHLTPQEVINLRMIS
ncbi:pseudouridine synthase [Robiginitalea aurantiaca]|uniref:Pseudouridine synthase n=1 Tax=Robiginitalea aurantiaca TaxID=3056915 RepID=A0ABT7WET3_9FLAO|nr:pseudouridine synthase [Robiginitalea aurantiaca]MDM9631431.1 pseudouridine synthase [Robiginitalea aurantiaca]